jgi:hypothetical protein
MSFIPSLTTWSIVSWIPCLLCCLPARSRMAPRAQGITGCARDLMQTVTASPVPNAAEIFRSAQLCAVLTAAALRTVVALRTIPGANFLVPRNLVDKNVKTVPGYARMTSIHSFDRYKALVSSAHPVAKEVDWARRNGLLPICAFLCISCESCSDLLKL